MVGENVSGAAALAAALEGAPTMVGVVRGPDHRFTFANEALRKAVGHRPVMGLPYAEALPELVDQGLVDLLDEVRRTGVPQHFDRRHVGMARGAHGELEDTWFTFSLTPILQGSPESGILIQGSEVSGVVRTEAQLRFTQAQLDAIVRDAPVGIAVFDGDARFLLLNEELASINGHSVDEHLGRTLAEVVPDMARENEPMIRSVFETGVAIRDFETTGETAADPGVIREWIVSYFPIFDEGRVAAVGATCLEVTALNRLRRELDQVRQREQRNLFRAAIDSMIESVLICSPVREDGEIVDFVITFANQALRELGGRNAEQLLGRRMLEAWPSFGDEALFDEYRRTVETGEPCVVDGFEYSDVIDGREAWGVFDLRIARLNGDLLLAWRDVSDRVEKERLLLQSRVRLERNRAATEQLQAALIPADLPAIEGVRLAAGYQAASDDARVGGDWYDAAVLPDGRLLVTVGDVVGHGLPAVEVMSSLRNGVRLAALDDSEPTAVLRTLDDFLVRMTDGAMATGIVAVYDPSTCRLQWASAGHLPPLGRIDGRWSALAECSAPPLGAGAAERLRAEGLDLSAGDAIIFYTDGLVEVPGEPIDDGIERAIHIAASSGVGEPDATCMALMAAQTGDQRRRDDTCLLMLEVLGPSAPR